MEQAIQQTWSLGPHPAIQEDFTHTSGCLLDVSPWLMGLHTLSLSTEVSHHSSLPTISNSKIGTGDRKKLAGRKCEDILPGGVILAKFWVKQTEK